MNRPMSRPAAMLAALLLAAIFLAAHAAAQTPLVSWAERYDGPASLTDQPVQRAYGVGGVFVAGTSGVSSRGPDFTLLKYTPSGELAWARHHDGPAQSSDHGSAVLPDGAGGAFVCGHSWGGLTWLAALLHYDAAGNLLWVRSLATPNTIDLERGPRLARAPDGGLRMAMTSEGNFLVAAFDGGGTPLWTRAIDVVPGEDDNVTGLAVDSAGNTIVVGPVGGGFGGYVTVKLDPGGDVAWTDLEFGVFGNTLGPALVALDKGDEIVVTGVPESDCGVLQTRTWRLTPGGARLWTRDFPTVFCDTAEAVDMALDGHGNALVLCQATVVGESFFDFTLLKYSPQGKELWRRSLGFNNVDTPSALDVDRAGNAYLAGTAMPTRNSLQGLAASYAPDGTLRWMRLFDREAPGAPVDIAAGSRGEVYLSGWAGFHGTLEDILTVKLLEAARLGVRR